MELESNQLYVIFCDLLFIELQDEIKEKKNLWRTEKHHEWVIQSCKSDQVNLLGNNNWKC